MIAIVIAANNHEDVEWTTRIPKDYTTWIDQNDRTIGREAQTYLSYIVPITLNPDDELILIQGNPFDHDKHFLKHLEDSTVRYYGEVMACDSMSRPHWGCNLHSWCEVLDLPKKDEYRFIAGAQYRLTAEQIAYRPKPFYEALLNLTRLDNKSGYVLERLWSTIWRLEL